MSLRRRAPRGASVIAAAVTSADHRAVLASVVP